MQRIDDRIVVAARSWVGTRFAHQGRLKKTTQHKGGVDCLGLLVGIAAELELCTPGGTKLSALDKPDYGHIPDGERLRAALNAYLTPVPVSALRPGGILLLAPDGVPRHLGIVGETEEGLTLIHAYAQARAVVEHGLDAWWRARVAAAFRVPSRN